MEGQRNEGLKTAGFILQLAQLDQVIHAVFFGLDVTVEHGAVGVQPELMRDARTFQPLFAGHFVIADDAPHAVAKNFRAAAGQRIHTGVAQPLQHFALAIFARCAR